MKRIITLILFGTLIAGSLFAGQFYGGKGYLHTNSALVLAPGALDFSWYMRGFAVYDNGLFANGTSALSAAFGFSRHTELGFTQILYQDLNQTSRSAADIRKQALIPGNTYVRIKFGGYPIGGNVVWGVMPALRYRVAQYQNIHLEPYYSAGIEAELTTMLSYYTKPLYPEEAPSYHFNIGYLNHNDGTSPTDGAQAVNYLVSAVYPRPLFDLGIELYGNQFVKRPGVSVLGREDWTYVTPMVRYKLFKGMTFTMGLDVLLQGSKETSSRKLYKGYNYSPWRITGKMNFMPSTSFYAAPTFVRGDAPTTGRERRSYESLSSGQSPVFSRQELFRWGIEERGLDIQSVDLDLEKIRQERRKAEEELMRLKMKLEEKQRREGLK